MKSKIIVLISLILLISCDTDGNEPIDANENSLIGEWKMTESYISDGGSKYWQDANNGETIQFYENKKFVSNRFNACDTGIFSIKENELALNYMCSEFNSESENEDGFITFTIDLYANYFILTPTSGPICVEGCSYKYEKK